MSSSAASSTRNHSTHPQSGRSARATAQTPSRCATPAGRTASRPAAAPATVPSPSPETAPHRAQSAAPSCRSPHPQTHPPIGIFSIAPTRKFSAGNCGASSAASARTCATPPHPRPARTPPHPSRSRYTRFRPYPHPASSTLIPGRNIPAQNLVKDINVDLPELLLSHPTSSMPRSCVLRDLTSALHLPRRLFALNRSTTFGGTSSSHPHPVETRP